MFRDSLLENTGGPRRRWSALTAFAAQSAAVLIFVVLPLLYPEALPFVRAEHISVVPPAGSPPPAEAPEQRATQVVQHNVKPDDLMIRQPHRVPDRINMTPDEPRGPVSVPRYGIEGGSGPDVPNEVIASVIRPARVTPVLKQQTQSHVVLTSHLSQGLLISRVEPRYSEIAKKAGIEGEVLLAATIGRDGRIENLRALRGHPMLIPSAIDAVRQWRYRPYLLNDEAVEVETQVTVRFVLQR
jgi:periplasmic protein TonB